MATRKSVRNVPKRLEDDEFGLSSCDGSNFEADGVYGYMPEANDKDLLAAESSRGALNDEEDMDNSGAASSALFTSTVFVFQMSLQKRHFYIAKNKMDQDKFINLPSLLHHDTDNEDQPEDTVSPRTVDPGSDSGRSRKCATFRKIGKFFVQSFYPKFQ